MRSASVRGNKENERIVSFDEALEVVQTHAARQNAPQTVERISLTESLGRILAAPIHADRDQPPFDRSTRDGYAVRAAEASGAWLSILGQVPAGQRWEGSPLASGQTVAIMTGAPVPEGADAVVMLEHVEHNRSDTQPAIRLSVGRSIEAGNNIVPRGSEARSGNLVLGLGTEIDPAAVALAASCGASQVQVFARPEVSILATGDELVDIDELPGPQQIRNSNSYGLTALVTRAGGQPLQQPVAPDRREELEQSIRRARAARLMILTGGVSMGEYDLVEDVLLSLGAEFFFTGVRMQPGKPAVFGRLPESGNDPAVYFFGLPGNPVSTQVTFSCFVQPMLRALRGGPIEAPYFVQATLTNQVPGKPALTRVLPATLTSSRLRPEVHLVVWQGSGDMAANSRANCYAVLPEDKERFNPGDVITVLLR